MKYSKYLYSLSLLCFLPKTAHAYLDPGSGSYFFQVLLAAIFGAGVAVKMFWARIKGFFLKIIKKKMNNNDRF